jgi:hypothetical protein
MFYKGKKGLGPVVASALLLVVVFAIVGHSHYALLRSVHFEQVQSVSNLVPLGDSISK